MPTNLPEPEPRLAPSVLIILWVTLTAVLSLIGLGVWTIVSLL